MRSEFKKTIIVGTHVTFCTVNDGKVTELASHKFDGLAKKSIINQYIREHPELGNNITPIVKSYEKETYCFNSDILRNYGKLVEK